MGTAGMTFLVGILCGVTRKVYFKLTLRKENMSDQQSPMNRALQIFMKAMDGRADRPQGWGRALRWTARIWSALSVVVLLAFIVGEGINPSGPNEWLGLLFFPFGISVGMILAW
jgi:hypothetical protein